MKIPAVILAAGESRRMGSPKALLVYQGETFLSRLIRVLGTSCDPVVVVLGHDAALMRQAVQGGARIVENRQYALGQLTSLQTGLRSVPADAAYVLFTLVDHPAVSEATIAALVNAPDSPVAVPRFEGRRGHPVRLRREVAREILALPSAGQAKTVMRAHAAGTLYLDLDDPGVVDDIDDPEAYRRLLGREVPGAAR
ncbi:MAG: NTP transferase domain-containing protein [Bryobacteraceae bacterium]